MRVRCFIFLVFFFSVFTLKAQVQFSGWFMSVNTLRLNKKLSLHIEGQVRSTDQWSNVQTILLRTGLNVHLSKSLSVTAGYAYIPSRRTLGSLSELLAEHRIWQQALFNHRLSIISVSHRLRFEERFLPKAKVENNDLETDGYNQAFRFRYFIRNIIPLNGKAGFSKGWFGAVQEEVLLNTGNKSAVNGKTFDQNRLYLAVGYRLNAKIDLETGYMNQYINTASSFVNNHIVQVAVYKRL